MARGLRLVFCGINPGLWSAAAGYHFARPGNRFWKALHGAGFTDRLLAPSEQDQLLGLGIGITNLVDRATAMAGALSLREMREGASRLEAKLVPLQPGWVAFVGMQAYRAAFARPKATLGRQEGRLAGARVWLLPNPSGAQARYQLPDLIVAFGQLRAAVETDSVG